MSLISFAEWNCTSTWRGGDKNEEKMVREAWGGELFEGCNFYIFPSDGGNYSREAINEGTAIIWWNTVNPILCSYWWPEQARWVCLNLPSQDFLHCSLKKNVKSVAHNKSFIDLAWGQDNWIYICLFFFSIIIHLKPNFVFVNKNPKKNYGQYCAILTSKVVNSNAYFCSQGCLACEQVLLFGWVKWAAWEHVYFTRYPLNGELACRLRGVQKLSVNSFWENSSFFLVA